MERVGPPCGSFERDRSEDMRVCMLSSADVDQPYGSTIRPLHMGKHLVRLGVEVLHICEQPPRHEDGLESLCLRDFADRSEEELFRIILARCRRFSPDVIYSHQVFMGSRFGRRLSRLVNRPHVFDAHSSMAQEVPTYHHLTFTGKVWLILNEMILLHSAHRVIAPSIELRESFVKVYRASRKKIQIVKNGVETERFRPGPADSRLRNSLGIPPGVPVILFTNPRLHTFPSNEMALHALFRMMPEIERRVPEIRCLILGGGPVLARPSKNVIYAGFVEDLVAHINLADICLAPFPPDAICGGTRNKVCEYLACGKPIVATCEGMRGFDDAIPGEHYLLGEEGIGFIERLVQCIYDQGMAEQIGRNARRLSRHYDSRYLAGQLDSLFHEVTRSPC